MTVKKSPTGKKSAVSKATEKYGTKKFINLFLSLYLMHEKNKFLFN